MTNEELNKWLAGFMEWVTGESIGYAPAYYFELLPSGKYNTVIKMDDWNPTADRNQMALCEEKIPYIKLFYYYLNLSKTTGVEESDYEGMHWQNILTMVKSSPRQRAEAIYETMKE
jgi:hypothetical protein